MADLKRAGDLKPAERYKITELMASYQRDGRLAAMTARELTHHVATKLGLDVTGQLIGRIAMEMGWPLRKAPNPWEETQRNEELRSQVAALTLLCDKLSARLQALEQLFGGPGGGEVSPLLPHYARMPCATPSASSATPTRPEESSL